MANKGSFLTTDDYFGMNNYLGVNDYLVSAVSADGQCFIILQGDGNLVIYHGSGPSNQGLPIWASHTNRGPGEYFAILQSDGNFCIYQGSDPSHQGAFVWNSGSTELGQGLYFAVMYSSGNFVIYKGQPTLAPWLWSV